MSDGMAPDRCSACRSRWCPGATGGACEVAPKLKEEDSVGLYPHEMQRDKGLAESLREEFKRFSQRDVDIEQTQHKCRIPGCSGTIVRKFEQRYDPTSGPPIIGPGSRDQYLRTLVARYCEACGVMYVPNI